MSFFNQLANINSIESSLNKLSELTTITPKIQQAIDYAIKYHDGQIRKDGKTPYVVHPICVSCIVAFYGGDEVMICAALLHDVVEDTLCSLDDIGRDFGWDVGHLVDAMTKIIEIRKEELNRKIDEKFASKAMTFRKMLLASIKDIRALVIKISDRTHNMLTLDALSPDKQKRIAEETMLVYAPIAHRLGISSLKSELEELSFYYIFRDEYNKIDSYIKDNNENINLKLSNFVEKISNILLENGFAKQDFEIESRIKRYYSIYLKMQRKGVSIDEILDLLAIRIIVPNELDCYKVLGLLHLQLKPVVSRLKDYIALPKENGYQTIHTTIFDKSNIYEVQIRTFDMHKSAQYGIAAHWKYKSGGISPNLEWLNNLQHQQQNNLKGFYELATNELYKEDMVVFSPAGDIYNLPVGAVVLDFAYAVHSNIGDSAKEAFINHKKASLLQPLKNGDIIRIITADDDEYINPRCTWLDAVKTSKARSCIKAACKSKLKQINRKSALNILKTIFDSKPQIILNYLEENNLKKRIGRAARDLNYLKEVKNSIKGNFAREANFLGKIKINMLKLKQIAFDNVILQTNRNIHSIAFDYCCNPKFGDEIVALKIAQKAYIHHKMCEHAIKEIENGIDMLYVEWNSTQKSTYKVIVALENKPATLAGFLNLLAKYHCNVVSINFDILNNSFSAYCQVCFESNDNIAKLKENIYNKYKIIEFNNLKDAYSA